MADLKQELQQQDFEREEERERALVGQPTRNPLACIANMGNHLICKGWKKA